MCHSKTVRLMFARFYLQWVIMHRSANGCVLCMKHARQVDLQRNGALAELKLGHMVPAACALQHCLLRSSQQERFASWTASTSWPYPELRSAMSALQSYKYGRHSDMMSLAMSDISRHLTTPASHRRRQSCMRSSTRPSSCQIASLQLVMYRRSGSLLA